MKLYVGVHSLVVADVEIILSRKWFEHVARGQQTDHFSGQTYPGLELQPRTHRRRILEE